jgi:hypothetical protein
MRVLHGAYRVLCLVIILLMSLLTGCQRTPSQPQDSQNSTGQTPTVAASNQLLVTPTAKPTVISQFDTTASEVSCSSCAQPPVWNYFSDDFEGKETPGFEMIHPEGITRLEGNGVNNSTGLSIEVQKTETYVYINNLIPSTEGYVTFWFNPNDVVIPDQPGQPVPAKSLRIADVKGTTNYSVIAALRLWQPQNELNGYKAFLEWQTSDGMQFNLDSGQFDLRNGWQKITLGFHINEWVKVWVDDVLSSQVTGITHLETAGNIFEVGKANDDNEVTPSGTLIFDDISYQLPQITDLWVDALHGNDGNTGLTRDSAFKTIQKATTLAGPGSKVHILPGIYRESIWPVYDGEPSAPVTYVAEEGLGSVEIRGSESSKTLVWEQLKTNAIGLPGGVDPAGIYSTDLSSWNLTSAPRFVVTMDDQGNYLSRMPLAREPDWSVKTEWKTAEYWWSADGGSSKSLCNPVNNLYPNCDIGTRSMYQLTDTTSDSNPVGVEEGNLTTLGDLTGATLVALDSMQGHYVYRRTIVAHDVSAGRITVDRKCEHDEGSGNPGLGWGSKYYVEGKSNLLDSPGEWWYDSVSKKLYLWPLTPVNPAELNIEISRLSNGFNLSERSNIIVDGLSIEYFNENAIQGINDVHFRSSNNVVRNEFLSHANQGVVLYQNVSDDPEAITSHFTLEQSEIADMDSDAINLSYSWPNESAANTFTVAGITDTVIRGNQMHDLGFYTDFDNAIGISIEHPDQVRFEDNHVYNVAHNGVQFSWSVIQSDKTFGFSAEEIKTGGILVQNNIIEKTCQLTTDCAALKFWGDPPAKHVYKDVLLVGNTFRNVIGWSSVSEKRGRWSGGVGSQVAGMGGFGLYLDMVSGIHAYRNIAYNNAYAGYYVGGVWRDGDVVFSNNIAANSLYGMIFSGLDYRSHASINTQIINNMFINNERFGLWFTQGKVSPEPVVIDHNLYFNNGWPSLPTNTFGKLGDMLVQRSSDTALSNPNLAAIQTNTAWEVHGVDGNPRFLQYSESEHELFTTNDPDFNLTVYSVNVIDHGTTELPASLAQVLTYFNLMDQPLGQAYDIGAYEFR